MDSSRSVLIAGAGDVGMRLAQLRASAGDEVIALRRSERTMPAGVRGLCADIVSGEGWARLPRRPDVLVFCAAPDQRDEVAYRRLYVDGLRRLLDTLQVDRVVFVSSTAVFAEDDGQWVDETTPAGAETFNGRVLLDAEAELIPHPQAIALRLSGIYGPGRDYLLRRARSGDEQRRRWSNRIHVDDAAEALSHLSSLSRPDRLYLGSDDVPALECEVMAWVREREGLSCVTAAEGHEQGRRVSNTRLRASGWSPQYPDYRAGYQPLLAMPGV